MGKEQTPKQNTRPSQKQNPNSRRGRSRRGSRSGGGGARGQQTSVLVIGSGGREHALVWKLRQSQKVDKVFCAPGNAGIAQHAKCVNIKVNDIKGLVEFAQRNKIGLTVVGPEQPLAIGLVDEFQRRKLRVFGPERKAAQIEASKVFAKQFMQKYHVPTAPFKVFESAAEAMGFCKTLAYPAVIKADGLAAGKGVIVVHSLDEAYQTIEEIMLKDAFGQAGKRIVIESFVEGQEVSVMAITDGKTILPLLPSQDHKQALEGDKGPNTGGMGAYCPTSFVTPEIMETIHQFVLEPTIAGFRAENIPYRGVLYAGLMLTPEGPKVLEFNCRFGDPETQAVLPLMKTDLFEIMKAVADKKLNSINKIDWQEGAAACVVLTSKGYPGKYKTGAAINGLRKNWGDHNVVFHAGTRRDGKALVTAGGRVLGVVGINNDLKSALDKSYEIAKQITFDGVTYRRDIGFRVLAVAKS
ncbi:phosphoribosylamine--glycine ligase [bacterium]|nr:phosphoribosylamine--glycine ligase [bacterium]MCB2201630.1 phosphoribosylamine--glycine ligase [bacterium]